jgi:hypothetical protein
LNSISFIAISQKQYSKKGKADVQTYWRHVRQPRQESFSPARAAAFSFNSAVFLLVTINSIQLSDGLGQSADDPRSGIKEARY